MVTIVHIIDYKLGLVPCDLYTLLIHCLHREYRDCVSLSNLSKVIYWESEKKDILPQVCLTLIMHIIIDVLSSTVILPLTVNANIENRSPLVVHINDIYIYSVMTLKCNNVSWVIIIATIITMWKLSHSETVNTNAKCGVQCIIRCLWQPQFYVWWSSFIINSTPF